MNIDRDGDEIAKQPDNKTTRQWDNEPTSQRANEPARPELTTIESIESDSEESQKLVWGKN
ncbi:hypothetical protein C0995_009722, partial [Termitomyces sp. Mi166